PRSSCGACGARHAACSRRCGRGGPDVDAPARRRGAALRSHTRDRSRQARCRPPRRRRQAAARTGPDRARRSLCLAHCGPGSRMTISQLLRWSRLHERRARRWWASPWLVAIAAGVALAAFVEWRGHGDPEATSHSWLAAAVVSFALAFLRVPFHLYWRSDAGLLAQLPIGGGPLFDVALVRAVRAAV